MNAKQLRDSILHYAMQGKLLDYFSEDDSIIRKRELLTKSIDPLNNEYDFDIPKNWGLFKLGEVLKVSSGKNITKKDMIEAGEYPVYGGNGINGRYHSFNVEENTIVIGRVGFYCGAIHITDCKSWVTDNALIVDYDKTLLSKEWLVMALEYAKLGKTASATAQPVISGRKIYPLVIPIPPLEDQLAITKKVKILEKKVEKFNSLLNESNVLKDNFPIFLEKSILQFAMQGKLVRQDSNDEPAQRLIEKIRMKKEQLIKEKVIKKEKPLPPIVEEEIPFDIPSTWEWVRIRDIYYNSGQKKPDSEFCYIDVSCIDNKKGRITDQYQILGAGNAPSRARKIVHIGDVIYSTVRPYLQNIAIIKGDFEYETISSTAFVVMRPIKVYNKFLFYVLKSPYFNSLVESKMQGATYPAINDTNFNNLIVPLPPVQEQYRIVAEIEKLLGAIELIKNIEE